MKFRKFAVLFLLLAVLVAPAFAQDTASKSFTLVVNAAPIVISPSSLPQGMVGLVFTTTVSASGGVGPYTFSISAGSLPAGVSISPSTGVLSGTPTTAGLASFTVKVTDSETVPLTATQAYTVNILPTLVITTTSLPAANLGIAYTTTLAVTGGQSPYTFAISTGSLPTGLTLNPATGVISGTPTAAGSFTFTVTVTDSATNVVRIYGKAVIVASNRSTTVRKST